MEKTLLLGHQLMAHVINRHQIKDGIIQEDARLIQILQGTCFDNIFCPGGFTPS